MSNGFVSEFRYARLRARGSSLFLPMLLLFAESAELGGEIDVVRAQEALERARIKVKSDRLIRAAKDDAEKIKAINVRSEPNKVYKKNLNAA